ncbi:hypothetical protein [Desulfosoma sp.]
MVTQSPQELISLWEQILTGTYDPAAASSATAPTETTEVFSETLAEESQMVAEETEQGEPATDGAEDLTSDTVTKSQILATGQDILGAAWTLWQSLDEEVQEQMRLHAKTMAQQAAQRAKAYWSQLTPIEQAAAKSRAKQAAQHAVAWWQSLPA